MHDLLYAYDTLLFDAHANNAHKHMGVIIVGSEYGVKINWGEVEVFGVRCSPDNFTTDGLFV